ncbi:hypothetical protein TWF970_009834 [Orbilia oligospora]|uniref:Uncharacterized protein n=1 Tax=Orbilia oligospora TaxID=2813651 RepID=A0A7C8VDJ7_ORBOL|nr:hypothetical protein TWF970_009834 [Orbilia oligospora]
MRGITTTNAVRTIRSRSLHHARIPRPLLAHDPTKERVVILGSGWAGFTISRHLDKKKFQTVVVSPRSYFVFTPLLASTAVGTLEFRNTLEPVRGRNAGVEYIQGWADDVSFDRKTLTIEALTSQPGSGSHADKAGASGQGELFDIKYDKLIVAVGCYSQTFGTKGVRENALFLKDVGDARRIRSRILECFETASLPTTSEELRKNILNFAIVGGGPTGVEFAAELFDLCHEDLSRLYPTLIPYVKISIYDVAPKILPMFDAKLATYALNLFKRDGIKIKTEHHIQELRPGLPGPPGENLNTAGCFTLTTHQEGDIGVGMCVWSTGLMMNPFVQKALDSVHIYPESSAIPNLPENAPDLPSSLKWSLKRHSKTGGLMVDDRFRVQLVESNSATEATVVDVFAVGDVSVMENSPLPATAQVANQEARWLAEHLNTGDINSHRFSFRNLGVMTYLGGMRAIMQTGEREIKGRTAWLIWRGAYLTKTVSWRNKLLIPIYWAVNWVFGRDISRF